MRASMLREGGVRATRTFSNQEYLPDVRYESGVLAPKRPCGDFLLSVAVKLRIDTRQYSTLLLVPGVPD